MSYSDLPEKAWEKLSQVAVHCAVYDSRERLPHPKCLKGTRTNLLKHIYKILDNPEKSQLVWLHGTAGVGKSAVAFTVAERMRGLKASEVTTIEKRLAGTFFFSRTNTNRCTTGYFFATLAYQLARNFSFVRNDVSKAIIENPAILEPSSSVRDQMEALFLRPLRKLRQRQQNCPPLSFVIDALDECTSEAELVELISLLGQALRESDLPKLHILLTSRSEAHVREAMEEEEVHPLVCEIPVKTSGDGLPDIISLDGADVDNDIYVFLNHSFTSLRGRRRDFPQPTRDQLVQLATRAGRRFIVASTMMKFIDDGRNDPRDRLHTMLHLTSELTSGMDVYKLYDLILSTCADPNRAYMHLSVVATIADPLPASQISKLLGPGEGHDVETTLVQLRSVMDIPTDSSLPVNIYHSSVRDYVSNPSNCGLPNLQYIAPHFLLAYSSLRFMMDEIPSSTALLDGLVELNRHSNTISSKDPRNLGESLALVVQPLEPLQVLSTLLWDREDHAPVLRCWLETPDGRAWLKTKVGRAWLKNQDKEDYGLNEHGAHWLCTEGGQSWLQTEDAEEWISYDIHEEMPWVDTEAGWNWLQTLTGRSWLQTLAAQDWLPTLAGRSWLQTLAGRSWKQTRAATYWLATQAGREWLQTQSMQDWLQTHLGRCWLQEETELHWLLLEGGNDWLNTEGGSEWLENRAGKDWLWTKGGQDWLLTDDGKSWVQTEGGQDWLLTDDGKSWVLTKAMQDWLLTEDGKPWVQRKDMQDEDGKSRLLTERILDYPYVYVWLDLLRWTLWLVSWCHNFWQQTQAAKVWLWPQASQNWLKSSDGHYWLNTQDGCDWLQTRAGKDWLQTQSVLDWLQSWSPRTWLNTQDGWDWLQTQSGRDWLETRSGRDWLTQDGRDWPGTPGSEEWLRTESGRDWLQTWDGRNWLGTPGSKDWLRTESGRDWMQTQSGRDWLQTWLQTRDGQDWLGTWGGEGWLQTESGRDWLQTSHAEAWPFMGVWVTIVEFWSALEAVNQYPIVPDLPCLPAFQVIQHLKSLPDFLMFPVFLALRHHNHSMFASPQDHLPDVEIIRAMKAFVNVANKGRERSQSVSDALKYACHNWAIHLGRAPRPWDTMLGRVFHSFWNHHLLYWLEMQWYSKGLQACLVVLREGEKLAGDLVTEISPECTSPRFVNRMLDIL